MQTSKLIEPKRHTERGISLFLVAVGMVALLGLLGLGIDLVSLYAARSEAQRAADAAALAGATAFVTSGCTSLSGGCVFGGPQEALATQQAIDVGSQNKVGGQAPTIIPGPPPLGDIAFTYPTPENPTITVTVARDASHGGPMPTFFVKVFGVLSANISASATAEAFNPSGGNVPVGAKCIKPWLMPNCDWSRMVASGNANANPNCPSPTVPNTFASYFVNNGVIVNPRPAPSGVVGQLLDIKPGDPTVAAVPGKFYPIFLPVGSVASQCPSCAAGGGGGGPPSGSLYRTNIECCNENTILCGVQTVLPITGDMVGPTQQGVDCLIHQQGNSGQDILTSTSPPWQITAGSKNPYFPPGAGISLSDSIVTVPLYDGQVLCSGLGGCGAVAVKIVGYMQMFVKGEVPPQATVNAYVMNVAGCGTGGSGGGGGGAPVTSGGASPIPVRLIHN